MKQKLIRLSERYLTALQKHLERGPQASLKPALALGREATLLGVETLGLARMHEQALASLGLSSVKNAFTKLAGIFFNEANTPIEATHRAAQQGKAHLGRLEATLGRRTEALATSKRQLRRDIARRRGMETAFAKSGKRRDKTLEESLELQSRLRQLTHKVLAAQEDERKKISQELHDEIAQTLLGINVRLLSLKQGDRDNTKYIKNEIASTQRLIVKSARSVRRFARELQVHNPA